ETARSSISFPGSSIEPAGSPVSRSQNRQRESPQAVPIVLPPGRMTVLRTPLGCSGSDTWPSDGVIGQSRTVRSLDALASVLPSGVKFTDQTGPEWPVTAFRRDRALTSQSRTWPSLSEEARV